MLSPTSTFAAPLIAPVQGGVVHHQVDSFSSNTNGLYAMEIAYVALAAKTKPNIEPYSKPGCISMLHRELSCPGFKMMWAKIKELCWDGDDDGKVFGDIGSGYGQVCMMAMLHVVENVCALMGDRVPGGLAACSPNVEGRVL